MWCTMGLIARLYKLNFVGKQLGKYSLRLRTALKYAHCLGAIDGKHA